MARRRRGLPVDGVLLFDKPAGVSSNHALQRVRRLFRAQKAGHTGTLDPMATGLLPICFGEATKFSSFLLEADKVYLARVRLGEVTTTGDAEGDIVERHEVPELSTERLRGALAAFQGDIEQVPPMHSALKQGGRPLYELAREGKTVEREVRSVTVYDMRLVSYGAGVLEFEVSCSKGTYVRTLAEDLGRSLGCGAHLTALRRLKSGPFDGADMQSLSALEALHDQSSLEATLLPVDSLVAHLPSLVIDEVPASRLLHGQYGHVDTRGLAQETLARLYHDDAFLGLGMVKGAGAVAPRRLKNTTAELGGV
ncbi:tRNA pseudouridine(55) synthase TruB [Aidingimonas halophila]|uniref:tRNA pseudouridine synthase B n=1 Tax=Aidingimonas halophila TaxID=574349 RepID=A0A1H2YBE9_9GAMM|nr:tRNA pseudouridine(55) synthase TruB [Aidingimonas halophila]GHC34768.1 tRNA pseudouridine synthase B [Aidingimonas halophila]SDX02562.1 tRNA pseudouridine synthase B [Aidingimonas halophila]